MKRIVLLVGFLIAGGASSALAQEAPPIAPPSGPVAPYANPYGGPVAPGPGARGGMRGERRERIRAKLLARFDRNGDGRLTGRERVAAKRFIMKRRMMREMIRRQRGQRDF